MENAGVRAYLFGHFRLVANSVPVVFSTRKAACLFTLLLLNRGRSVSRERLWSSLWGDLDDLRARRNLNTTLWRMRRETSVTRDILIDVSRTAIKLDVVSCYVDTEDFRSRIPESETAANPASKTRLQEAESLYTADFLEGFPEEWCEEERRDLRRLYLQLLKRLSDEFTHSSEYEKACRSLERLIHMDPLNEEAHRDLMRVYHILGRGSAALTQFAQLRQVLNQELGIEPSDSTLQVFQHIRNQCNWTLREAGDGTTLAGVSERNTIGEIPLVGRAEEFQLLVRRLDLTAQGNGGGILLFGDLGIGKSKLVQAAANEAKLRGFDVLSGGCPDLESPPPYQVFVQAIWPRIVGNPGSEARLKDVFEHLVQGLSLSSPKLPDQRPRIEFINNAMINEWVISVLSKHSSSRPTLLILEDVHRIDSASHALLATLLSRLPTMRLLILASVRTGEARTDEVLKSLMTNGIEVHRLNPLSSQDISTLVKAIFGRVSSANKLVQFAWQRTGGIPLFVVELLKFMLAENCLKKVRDDLFAFEESRLMSLGEGVPSHVLDIIGKRIQRLDKRTVEVLSTAAVIGSQISVELLEQLLGLAEDQFVDCVEVLLDLNMLTETSSCLAFPHESVRLAAIRSLPRTRLKKLHSKTALLLERLEPARKSDIGWHHSEAGNMEKASEYFESSGDDARLVHANEDASRWYTRSLEALMSLRSKGSATMRRKAVLLLKRHDSLDLSGDRTQQSRDIEEVLQIAQALGDRNLIAQAMFHRSQVLSRMNNREALAAGLDAERLFLASGDISGAARAAEGVGLAYINLRNQGRARLAFNRSLSLFRKAIDRTGEARALVNLGTVISFAGNNQLGMRHLDEGESILRDLGDKRSLAGAILQKGVLCRCMGQSSLSEKLLENGISLMREIGDKVGEARGLSQLAVTQVALGKLREALHGSVSAMRLAREANDVRAQIVFLNNAADGVMRCIGDFDRAERYIIEAIRLVAGGGPLENSAIYYDTMAAVLLEKQDYDGALRWARKARALYRLWEGHFNFVGNDIDFHLGLAYLRTRKLDQAGPLLEKATRGWKTSSDIALEIHGLAALAEYHLEVEDYEHSLECVRKAEVMLRKVDGLTEIQKVYRIQARVFQSVGAEAAAKRALVRARSAVLTQARSLKGRFRNRFLESVPTNRAILQQFETMMPLGKGDAVAVEEKTVGLDPALRISTRRRALLNLISTNELSQKEIAARLRVSPRTVRGDLLVLRKEGLIEREFTGSKRNLN